MKPLTPEKLEDIRGNIRIYDNRVAERDVKALLGEVERLQAVIRYYLDGFAQGQNGDWPKPRLVPSAIRLPFRISGDWPIGHETQVGPGDFECKCNQYGAISVLAENGTMLGVKLHECEILELAPNDKL